jgi:ATP-binding cassette, subfamily C, bacterial
VSESFFTTTWRLAREVLRGRAGWVWSVAVLSAVNGAAQGATVMLLVPLLEAAGVPVPGGGAVGQIEHVVGAAFGTVGLAPSLPVVLVVFVALAWLQAAVERRELVESTRVEQAVERDLRTALYSALLQARWSFFTERRGTDLAHAITQDADRAAVAVSYLLRGLGQSISALVYLVFAFAISPEVTIAALGGGLLLVVALRRTFRLAYRTGVAMSDASTETLALVTHHVEAIKLVKSFGAEQRTQAAFDGLADRSARVAVDATRAHAGAHVATTAGSATLLALVLFAALIWLHLPAAATLVLAFLFWRLLPRLMDVQHSLRDAIHELPGYDAVQRVLADAVAAREVTGPVAAAPALTVGEAVRFDGVAFGYPGAAPVLNDVWAEIPAGRITMVTGPSGAGKTTLVDLVLGLLRPTSGRILVDGVLLSGDRLDAWRDVVAYVPQESLFLHDTIRANLLWARPGATDDDVRAALRLADADGFVGRLPRGLDTVVGDRGVRFSGGERQRLSLARALLRRPTLLVLDEPTSALDAESEARVLAVLATLRGTVTTLVVTHRTAPLREADIVYVMDGGRLRRQVSEAL